MEHYNADASQKNAEYGTELQIPSNFQGKKVVLQQFSDSISSGNLSLRFFLNLFHASSLTS